MIFFFFFQPFRPKNFKIVKKNCKKDLLKICSKTFSEILSFLSMQVTNTHCCPVRYYKLLASKRTESMLKPDSPEEKILYPIPAHLKNVQCLETVMESETLRIWNDLCFILWTGHWNVTGHSVLADLILLNIIHTN